jgi:hypothetical protein
MNLSVLIHTFNGYQHLWYGSALGLSQFVPGKIYWGSDVSPTWPIEKFNSVYGLSCSVIFSGHGEWSDRLTRLLHQIQTDYVLYMQEDHWPIKSPPDLSEMMGIVSGNNLLRLQISPVNHFYKLNGAGEILFFDPSSKYLVSHQPSIWKKSFLLNCLKPGETPWVNEYKGTLRLQQTSQIRDYITNKIAIYPYDWYKHMCIKGKVVES